MKRQSNKIRLILLVVDLILINISLITCYYYRYPESSLLNEVYYINLLLFLNIDWVLCTFVFGTYKIYRVSSIEKIFQSFFKAIFLHILLVTAFWVFIKGYYYSRQILFTTYILFIMLSLIWKILNYYYQIYLRKKGKNLRRVVIAGYGEAAFELAHFFKSNSQFGYKFMGYFDDNRKNENIIGDYSLIKDYVLKQKINEIYCLVPDVQESLLQELLLFGANNVVRIKIIPNIKSYLYAKSKLDLYGSIPILVVKEEPLEDEFNMFVKRFFDIIFSLIVILLVFPWLLPLIGIIIKIESKGPVFFVQKRSGKNYQSFSCLKFRTMVNDKESTFIQATKNDSRVTKMGAFLRKTSLDEVPQFINVFIGQMSVVGPRPHPIKLDDEYKNQINKYMSRNFVKPGITGLSQVMGYRGETNEPHLMKARVKIDNFYIENWSFLLDLKIILQTVFKIFKRDEKAY